MSDVQIARLKDGAVKRQDSSGRKFVSHTDRYDNDPEYRSTCDSLRPPTPRLLQFSAGVWAAVDGADIAPPKNRP